MTTKQIGFAGLLLLVTGSVASAQGLHFAHYELVAEQAPASKITAIQDSRYQAEAQCWTTVAKIVFPDEGYHLNHWQQLADVMRRP